MPPYGGACCTEADVWRIVWRDYAAIVPGVQLLAGGADGRFLATGASPFGADLLPRGYFPDGYDPTGAAAINLLNRWTLYSESNAFDAQGVTAGNFLGMADIPTATVPGQGSTLVFAVAAVAGDSVLLARPDLTQGMGLPPGPAVGGVNNLRFWVCYIAGVLAEAAAWINSQVAPSGTPLDVEWHRQAAAWKAAALLYFAAWSAARDDKFAAKMAKAEKMAEAIRALMAAVGEETDIALVAPMTTRCYTPALPHQLPYSLTLRYRRAFDECWEWPVGF